MRDIWEVKSGSHSIRVENTVAGVKLWVDGVLQDEQIGFSLSSRLFGKVKNEDGEFEDIKVSVGFKCLKIRCLIFAGDQLVYSTDIQWEG